MANPLYWPPDDESDAHREQRLLDAQPTEEQLFWDEKDAQAQDDDLGGDWPNEDSDDDDDDLPY